MVTPIAAMATIGGYVGVVAWWPQLRKTARSKRAADISYIYLQLTLWTVALWMAYGLQTRSGPLVAVQVPNYICAATLAALKGRSDNFSAIFWRFAAVAVAVDAAVLLTMDLVPAFLLGTLGGWLGVGSWLAQVVRAWRRRSAADFSTWCLGAVLVCTLAWIAYGVARHSVPLQSTQSATACLLACLLTFKLAPRVRLVCPHCARRRWRSAGTHESAARCGVA